MIRVKLKGSDNIVKLLDAIQGGTVKGFTDECGDNFMTLETVMLNYDILNFWDER